MLFGFLVNQRVVDKALGDISPGELQGQGGDLRIGDALTVNDGGHSGGRGNVLVGGRRHHHGGGHRRGRRAGILGAACGRGGKN